MIIGYNNNELATIEINVKDGKLTISGVIGEFMHEDDLYDSIDDFFENVDMESEFGYMADEKELLYEEREEFLENLWNELKDNSYPYEIYRYYNPMVMTCHTAGQCNDEIKKMVPLIPLNHFNFIMAMWEDNHLNDISLKNQKYLGLIEKNYDEQQVLEKVMKIFNE